MRSLDGNVDFDPDFTWAAGRACWAGRGCRRRCCRRWTPSRSAPLSICLCAQSKNKNKSASDLNKKRKKNDPWRFAPHGVIDDFIDGRILRPVVNEKVSFIVFRPRIISEGGSSPLRSVFFYRVLWIQRLATLFLSPFPSITYDRASNGNRLRRTRTRRS